MVGVTRRKKVPTMGRVGYIANFVYDSAEYPDAFQSSIIFRVDGVTDLEVAAARTVVTTELLFSLSVAKSYDIVGLRHSQTVRSRLTPSLLSSWQSADNLLLPLAYRGSCNNAKVEVICNFVPAAGSVALDRLLENAICSCCDLDGFGGGRQTIAAVQELSSDLHNDDDDYIIL
uniref:Uncharacterized protein n=1 Tax=Parascaris univalens TaxID=6257 RepID=A0A915AR67_PARUN